MENPPLTRLSPELRNQIYAHVFTSRYAVTLQATKCQHALTKTCKQLRRETLAMYFSLTSFNAHLDDGPATPLTKWLKVLGPDAVCGIKRVNVWDLHMLQFTLHGMSAAERILQTGSIDSKWYHQTSASDNLGDLGPGNNEDHPPSQNRKTEYLLRTVDLRFADRTVKDVFLALHSLGLGMARFVVRDTALTPANEAQQAEKLTSEFAVVPLHALSIPSSTSWQTEPTTRNPWSDSSSTHASPITRPTNNDDTQDTDAAARAPVQSICTLQSQLQLSESAYTHLVTRLSLGERTVTIREQRRVVVLEFAEVESGLDPNSRPLRQIHPEAASKRDEPSVQVRLKDFRQAMMSEASHDMIHSVVGAMRNWRAVP